MHFVVTVQQRCGNFMSPFTPLLPPHIPALPGASVRPAVPVVTMSVAVPASDEASAQVYVRDRVYCVSSLARRRTQRISYCHLFCSFCFCCFFAHSSLPGSTPCSCWHFTRHLTRSIWVSNAKSFAFACSRHLPQSDVAAVRSVKCAMNLATVVSLPRQ